jgi:FYVE zinc finger
MQEPPSATAKGETPAERVLSRARLIAVQEASWAAQGRTNARREQAPHGAHHEAALLQLLHPKLAPAHATPPSTSTASTAPADCVPSAHEQQSGDAHRLAREREQARSSPPSTSSEAAEISGGSHAVYHHAGAAKAALVAVAATGSESLRPVWVPDDYSAHCTLCKAAFSTFRRRHHCRLVFLFLGL